MTDARTPRKPTDLPAQRIGLSWVIEQRGANEITWHGGATGGFFAFIGLDQANHTASVVLSNSRQKHIDDIGFHLLDARQPLTPVPTHTEIDLPASTLAQYVGSYDFLGGTATVTEAAGGLVVDIPGEGSSKLYAESPTSFYFKDFDGRVDFHLDDRGYATSGTFHDQDGQMASAVRQRHPITLAADVLDGLVGTYDLAGETAIVTRSTHGLTVQLPDGPQELLPETPTRFFLEGVDIQVTFDVGPNGRATGAVLRQAGEAPLVVKRTR